MADKREIVQQSARVEQPLFLRFADPPVAAPLVLRDDSESSTMERRGGEQFAPDRPVADMTEPGKVPIRRRNCATGATYLEVLNRFGTFESLCWQLTELRSQNRS